MQLFNDSLEKIDDFDESEMSLEMIQNNITQKIFFYLFNKNIICNKIKQSEVFIKNKQLTKFYIENFGSFYCYPSINLQELNLKNA